MSTKNNNPADAAAGNEAAERNDVLYQRRLKRAGLPRDPVALERKAPQQFEVAMIAATLTRQANATPTKLAAEAVDIWNASGSAVLVETQAGRLAKGVMYYNTQDWLVNAMSLVAMFDANHGGVPGHKAPEESKKIHEQARVDAAKAVIRLWGHGPDNGVVLGCLFSAANETEDSRKKKMIELVEYAKSAPAKSGSLLLGAKTCDRQTESVRSAWMPLGEWGDNALESAVKQIKALLEPPASAVFGHRWGGNPMVVRWLTVMRSQQLSAKKNRAGG